jgi:heme exporter protein CcmD
MDWTSPHLGFVSAAYGVSLITLAAIAFAVFLRRASLKRHLQKFESKQGD